MTENKMFSLGKLNRSRDQLVTTWKPLLMNNKCMFPDQLRVAGSGLCQLL